MRRALALALALLAALPAAAGASRTQESTFQDDNLLVYVPPAELRKNLDMLKSLGVDRIRVTVLWKIVAPEPGSRTRPAFDATMHSAYPPGAWDRYDAIVREAAARGIAVNFNVTGPGPLWAHRAPPRPDIADTFEPSPAEFAAFVAAAGRRYSGEVPGIPRIDYWSIWNEPNHSGWLTPTWDGKPLMERSAVLYRELVDGAWAALNATGHAKDTILIGETAPKGDRSKGVKRYMQPLIFLRALYCVDRRLRPLKGAAAARLGCAGSPAEFRSRHPALFAATGYAHHPYELVLPPVFPPRRDEATIANLATVTKMLDRIFRRYGSRRSLGLYLTEYGYQTNPPDGFGVSWKLQAAYLNQSEYIAWRNRRVRTLSQFLLRDDRIEVPASFQSGLMTIDGTQKPALSAYRIPIWLPRSAVRRGTAVRVWGLLRAAPNGRRTRAAIEYRRGGSKRWRRLRSARSDTRNYLQARVRVPVNGHLRIKYAGDTSRAALIRVG